MHTKFWSEILNGMDHSEDVGVDWLHLAQNRDKWRALVNTNMKLRVT